MRTIDVFFDESFKALTVVKVQQKYKVQNPSSLILLPWLAIPCLSWANTSVDSPLAATSRLSVPTSITHSALIKSSCIFALHWKWKLLHNLVVFSSMTFLLCNAIYRVPIFFPCLSLCFDMCNTLWKLFLRTILLES